MDGIHDLGGLAGFGPVEVEPDEPVFHAPWERAVVGLLVAVGSAGLHNGGRFRHSIERMDPAHYLSSSYYEHWLTGLATTVVERGVTDADDLEGRAGGRFPLSRADRGTGHELDVTASSTPRFAVGDAVRVRAWHPHGHTRAPRYVQGRRGVVVRVDGAFSVPDVEAHRDDAVVNPTYSVRFEAAELWGEGAEAGAAVHVDLWECYLEEDR
jgi:nitrile hydratase subunit beta